MRNRYFRRRIEFGLFFAAIRPDRIAQRRNQMSFAKITMLAGGLALALAAAAPAREFGELEIRERALMYVNPTTGKVMMMRLGNRGHEMIMRNARPLATGTFLYRSGGTVYLLEDKDGKMMQDIAKGDYD
jgi:hypothetical protein